MAKGKSVQKSEGKWAKLLLPVSLVVLSLVMIPSLNDPATLPRTMIWTASVLIWLIWKMRQVWKTTDFQTPSFPKWIVGSIGLLLLANLLSLFAAHSLAESIQAISRLGVMLGSIYVVAWELRETGEAGKQNWTLAIWALGAIQSILAAGHFVMNLGGQQISPVGTQMNSNLMGVVMVLALPAAVYLIFEGLPKLRWLFVGSIPMLIGGVYLSASRTALLIIFIYAILTLVFCFTFIRKNEWLKKNRLGFAGLVVLVVIGAGLMMMYGSKRKESRLKFEFLRNNNARIIPQTNSIEVRFALWNRSVQMGKSHPITGIGAGNWKLEIPSYGVKGYDHQENYGMHFFLRPHNDYLWVFAETGILGLLGYLGLLGGLVVLAIRQILRAKSMEEIGFVAVALFGIVAYMVDAFFSFPVERMENTVVFAVLAAFILDFERKQSSRQPIGNAAPKALLGLILVLFGFQFGISAFKLPKDAANLELRTAKIQKNWKAMAAQAKRADSWWTRYDAHSATPFAWYAAVAHVEQARVLGKPGQVAYDQLMEKALQEVNSALEYAPYNLMALTELGSTYAQMNRFPEAIVAYKALLKVFPDNNEAWVNLGVCHYNQKDFEAAKAVLSNVEPSYSSPNLEALRNALSQ